MTISFNFNKIGPSKTIFSLQIQEAEDSLKYYKSFEGKSDQELNALNAEFERLNSIAHEKKTDEKIGLKDICE